MEEFGHGETGSLVGLRRTFRSGKTRGIQWQSGQLRALLTPLKENEARIFEALEQDLGKHPVESSRDEIGVVKKSAEHSLLHIKEWMAPKKSFDLRPEIEIFEHGETRGLVGLRRTFRSGKARGIQWRIGQLRALLKLLKENEARIFEALEQDLRKHPVESYSDEIGVVKKSAEHSLLHIKEWMAPKKV